MDPTTYLQRLPAAGAEPTGGENAIRFEPDLRAICHDGNERGRAGKRESLSPPRSSSLPLDRVCDKISTSARFADLWTRRLKRERVMNRTDRSFTECEPARGRTRPGADPATQRPRSILRAAQMPPPPQSEAARRPTLRRRRDLSPAARSPGGCGARNRIDCRAELSLVA